MNKMNNTCLTRQGRYSLQDVVSEIHEIASVSEKFIKINSLIMNIAGQANFLSARVAEEVHARGIDEGLVLIAHEAYNLAEFSNEQSKAIWHMFTEIKESVDKINCSTDKVLNNFGVIDQGVRTAGEQEDIIHSTMKVQSCGNIHAPWAAGTGQVNKAAEVFKELEKMNESISSLTQSVLSKKFELNGK